MLIITSPAKTLDFKSNWNKELAKNGRFIKEAVELVSSLSQLSQKQLQNLFGVSEKIAKLNYERYQAWEEVHNTENSKPAILVYDGDIYKELRRDQYQQPEIKYAQNSLRIISGLYGILRAYDLIQPYRLEMKTKLKTKKAQDLYDFWGTKLTDQLNEDVKLYGSSYLVNLASNEYAKAVDLKKINCDVLEIEFRQKHGGELKNYGILAKKARGMMIDFMIKNKVRTPEELQAFAREGYKYTETKAGKLFFVKDY